MHEDNPIDPEVEKMLSTLDSIFQEDPTPPPNYHQLNRKHAALSMELEAFDRDPENSLNRRRESIIEDLAEVIEQMKRQHD